MIYFSFKINQVILELIYFFYDQNITDEFFFH